MWRERLFWLRFRADDLPWLRIIALVVVAVVLYSCWSWSRRAVALSIVNGSPNVAVLELGSDRREIAGCSSVVQFVDLDRSGVVRVGSQSVASGQIDPPAPSGFSYFVLLEVTGDGSVSRSVGVPVDSPIWDIRPLPAPLC